MRNPVWSAWLHLSDALLSVVATRTPPPITASPKRLLLAVGGHLGDAVLATSVLPSLRRMAPGAEIGVLCGSWSASTFARHPAIRRVHVVDHWRPNRSGGSLMSRWLRFLRTRRTAVREIRETEYDIGVDLYPYYPNFAPVLARARVVARVGYASGGYSALYTHALEWEPGAHAALDHQRILARAFHGAPIDLAPDYDLSPQATGPKGVVEARLPGSAARPFVVLHPGSGTERKEWPLPNWIALARALSADGFSMALTGLGARDLELTNAIAAECPLGVVNLCNQLDWEAFRLVIAAARLVISVDTVAMHLAGAAGVNSVVLMTAMDDPQRWRPLGQRSTILFEQVPCAPCYRSRGCEAMSCVRDVSVERVLAAATAYLGVSESRSDTLPMSKLSSSS